MTVFVIERRPIAPKKSTRIYLTGFWTTRLEGCKGKGGSFWGAVRFRIAMNAALISISNKRATERVTINRPVLGLPAITLAFEMPMRYGLFPSILYLWITGAGILEQVDRWRLDLAGIFRVGLAHRQIGVLGRIRGFWNRKWLWSRGKTQSVFDGHGLVRHGCEMPEPTEWKP